MSTEPAFVIVGASLAGAKAAERLRKGGSSGTIRLVGAEDERPYERPPLSKGYLLGTEEREKAYVHAEGWYAENDIELTLGRRATGLDPESHTLGLDDGTTVGYTKLLITTGSSPRRLDVPGADLGGVLYLRDLGDSDRLRETVAAGGNLVVVGAGWIGLEAAAAARASGCTVTVIEPQSTPLRAALGDEMGGFFADLHRDNGVDLRFGRTVREIRGTDRVSAVITDDGEQLPADAVIVGVGITPNTELAESAGLTVDNGILVDQTLRTSDADVYAAGDVARSYVPRYDTSIRVEHWSNAIRGGTTVARSMLGEEVAYDRVPYFFSDQYDVGMEFTGWFPPGGYDRVVTRGEPSPAGFFAFWLAGGHVVAGMHVNQWDDGVKPLESLIKSGRPVDADRLADPGTPLSDVVGD